MINPIGYFRIHRELYHKPIWKQSTPEQKVILMALLAMAWFKPNEWEWNGKKFNTEPGQFITSLQSITEDCGKGITVKNVRTALKRFEKLGFLANESTKTGRLITIANWSLYQAKANEVAKETASGWQRGGKEVATKEERKKETKKENKDISKKFDSKTDAYTKEFEELYKLYPRAKAKRQTFINYCGRLKAYSHEELLNCVKVYKIQVENSKSFNYSSNNFFGTKAYFEDFLNIKVEDAKPIIDIDDDKGRGHLLGAVCNTGKITRRPKVFEDVVVDD